MEHKSYIIGTRESLGMSMKHANITAPAPVNIPMTRADTDISVFNVENRGTEQNLALKRNRDGGAGRKYSNRTKRGEGNAERMELEMSEGRTCQH